MPVDDAQRIRGVLIVAEVEELVLLNRSPDGCTELAVMRGWLGPCEVVPCLCIVIIAEAEDAAVERIGARLKRDARYRASGASEFNVEVARADADAFDGIGGRDQHL